MAMLYDRMFLRTGAEYIKSLKLCGMVGSGMINDPEKQQLMVSFIQKRA
jgi:hypothetical protein